MKPILFNTEMVRAIMDGRKTATRRVVKPQPKSKLAYVCMGYKYGTWSYPGEKTWEYWEDESFRLPDGLSSLELNQHWTPPCHTGDILYVRETWAVWSRMKGTAPKIHYKADGETLPDVKWRPSIHMPFEFARLFLRVKSVKVERLQEISGQGLIEEGLFSIEEFRVGMIRNKFSEFEQLWNSTLKPADRALYGWNADPWVWVIEFERISREEAAE